MINDTEKEIISKQFENYAIADIHRSLSFYALTQNIETIEKIFTWLSPLLKRVDELERLYNR